MFTKFHYLLYDMQLMSVVYRKNIYHYYYFSTTTTTTTATTTATATTATATGTTAKLQVSCHSVAVVLTLVQTKQIRINTVEYQYNKILGTSEINLL